MLLATAAIWLAYIRPRRGAEALDEPIRTGRAPIEPAGID
jgi:hypothetical protein